MVPMVRIDQQGNVLLPIPETPKLPKQEKIKEKNMVDRYLTWMDGEAKKLKSLVVLPAMCQIFSVFLYHFSASGCLVVASALDGELGFLRRLGSVADLR